MRCSLPLLALSIFNACSSSDNQSPSIRVQISECLPITADQYERCRDASELPPYPDLNGCFVWATASQVGRIKLRYQEHWMPIAPDANGLTFQLDEMVGASFFIGLPTFECDDLTDRTRCLHDSDCLIRLVGGYAAESEMVRFSDDQGECTTEVACPESLLQCIRCLDEPCVETTCGNSVIEFGEECDDGNSVRESCVDGGCVVCDENCALLEYDADTDEDGVLDQDDNCRYVRNASQADDDRDGEGNECDNCAATPNTRQRDEDGDGIGDLCDNCPMLSNADQSDTDGDGIGDECDDDLQSPTVCGDGRLDITEECENGDPDLAACEYGMVTCEVCDANCNFAEVAGSYCGDGYVDLEYEDCDPGPNGESRERCADGICQWCTDECLLVAQDSDSDGIPDEADNCPQLANPGQSDTDMDGVGNFCDNCPDLANSDQRDDDADGMGNFCSIGACANGVHDENEQCDPNADSVLRLLCDENCFFSQDLYPTNLTETVTLPITIRLQLSESMRPPDALGELNMSFWMLHPDLGFREPVDDFNNVFNFSTQGNSGNQAWAGSSEIIRNERYDTSLVLSGMKRLCLPSPKRLLIGIAVDSLFSRSNVSIPAEARVAVSTHDNGEFFRADFLARSTNDFFVVGLLDFCNETVSSGALMRFTGFQNGVVRFEP